MTAERQALLARESKVTEREAVLRRRMDDKVNERLREAREEVDSIVADLKGKAGSLVRHADNRARAALSTGEIGGLRAGARAALEAVAERLDDRRRSLTRTTVRSRLRRRSASPCSSRPSAPRASSGAWRGSSWTSRSAASGCACGSRTSAGTRAQTPDGRPRTSPGVGRRRPHGPPPWRPRASWSLIGATVDDAIARAEKFLDDALLADERRLRVVHGHGTGRLREAIRRHLRDHPLVARSRRRPTTRAATARRSWS